MSRKRSFWLTGLTLSAVCLFLLLPGLGLTQSRTGGFKNCISCHPEVEQEMAKPGGHKPFADFQCSGCHNPHAAKFSGLLKDRPEVLCRNCHEEKSVTQMGRYVHVPFQDGECLSCHSPHVSDNPNLLKASGQDLCFTCHEKKGSFNRKYTHSPVRQGRCLSCHQAHSSDNDFLTKKPRTDLCASCHSSATAAANRGHQGYSVKGSDCMSCHSPHGAERNGLVKQTLHAPFAKKDCRGCHSGSSAQVKGNASDVCLTCHQDTVQSFMKINSHISDGVFCVNCHSPHASDQAALKKSVETKICLACHQDTQYFVRGKENRFRHPMVDKGECSSCHRPHGSNYRLMFADTEITLCTKCHERHATFTHPIGKNTVDPRSKRDITCITCHKLMGSPFEYALRQDRRDKLCLECHKDY
jgi:predicted CXXCH cytochrome family protein